MRVAFWTIKATRAQEHARACAPTSTQARAGTHAHARAGTHAHARARGHTHKIFNTCFFFIAKILL